MTPTLTAALVLLAILGGAEAGGEDGLSTAPLTPITLRGRLVRIQPWCGGAEPADGIGTTEHPYTGTLHIKAGGHNNDGPVVAVLEPDSQGRFELEITPGQVYCGLTEDKLQPQETWVQAQVDQRPGYQHNRACHAKHWAHCTVLLAPATQAADDQLILKIHDRCGWSMPCVVDAPAPPPSAAPGG